MTDANVVVYGGGGAYCEGQILPTEFPIDDGGYEPFVEDGYEGALPLDEELTKPRLAAVYVQTWWLDTQGLIRNLWNLWRKK